MVRPLTVIVTRFPSASSAWVSKGGYGISKNSKDHSELCRLSYMFFRNKLVGSGFDDVEITTLVI